MGFKIDTWAPHIYYDISEAKCLQRKLLPLTGSPFFSASSFLKAIPFALNEFFFFYIRLLIISQQPFAQSENSIPLSAQENRCVHTSFNTNGDVFIYFYL